jgi:hypothetical protein
MHVMNSVDIMAGYEPKDEREEAEIRDHRVDYRRVQKRMNHVHEHRAFAPVVERIIPLRGHIRGLELLK